jgi:hypothetical protein
MNNRTFKRFADDIDLRRTKVAQFIYSIQITLATPIWHFFPLTSSPPPLNLQSRLFLPVLFASRLFATAP